MALRLQFTANTEFETIKRPNDIGHSPNGDVPTASSNQPVRMINKCSATQRNINQYVVRIVCVRVVDLIYNTCKSVRFPKSQPQIVE